MIFYAVAVKQLSAVVGQQRCGDPVETSPYDI